MTDRTVQATALVFLLGEEEPVRLHARTDEERAELRRTVRRQLQSGACLQVIWTSYIGGQVHDRLTWGAEWSGGSAVGAESR